VINHLDGAGDCGPAGYPGDSCYWIDALGVRLGRDGDAAAWDTDQVDWYAASVTCDICAITAGQGKPASAGFKAWEPLTYRPWL
jgi:hypothetical protein